MPRSERVVVHLPRERLQAAYRVERDSGVRERLLAILHIYDGRSVGEDAARSVRRCEKTVRNWLKRWNEYGYDGLKPGFTGGPRPKLSHIEWDRMAEEVEGRAMTIRDVTVYVKTSRGVEYAYKTVLEILRKKRGRYRKPYIKDKRRPENAEETIKKGQRNPLKAKRPDHRIRR